MNEKWCELIAAAGADRSDKPRFQPPAMNDEIRQAEAALAVKLPGSLIELLLETNGVQTDYGEFIWSARQIADQNLDYRTNPDFAQLYMPFGCLLFFAEEGNGDLFAFRVLQGEAQSDAVFRWDHESDSRTLVAGRLESFVGRWLRNELSS